jgi:hypothetical protein
VYYSYIRPLITLRGEILVKVTVCHCIHHPQVCVHVYDPEDVILVPGCKVDMRVIVLIGLLRWRLGMKRREIQLFLAGKHIDLSSGVISYRSLDFLLLFHQFHMMNAGKLKQLFQRQHGMILHVDGTFRSGGDVVFVLQDDGSEIIIDASLIPSEAEEYVTLVLQDFKCCFGSPLGVVRDMAEGISLSVSRVFPSTFQQICQVHFMRNFETDVIAGLHNTVKRLLVKHRITSVLKGLRRSDDVIDMKGLQRWWVHVIVDYLVYPLGGRVKWMSRSLSYYEQYCRIQEVFVLIQRLIRSNAGHGFMCREVMELKRCLQSVLDDTMISSAVHLLGTTLDWLDELCELLRVSREDHLKDFDDSGCCIGSCKKKIERKLAMIVRLGGEYGKKYERVALRLKKGFDRHWDELFIPDPMVDGERVSFRRHNNALESSHRRLRKSIRERTGRRDTNHEMEQFGDVMAVLSNLWNETYQKEILCTVDDFAVSLSLFVEDLPGLRKEYRKGRCGPQIPIADDKRVNVLTRFVEIVESGRSYDELVSPLVELVC